MASIWNENREILRLVRLYVHRNSLENAGIFSNWLDSVRPRLLNLFTHRTKNDADRKKVEEAPSSGLSIDVPGRGLGTVQIPQQFVNFAAILSDLYNMNEMDALYLIIFARNEKQNYPAFGEGLIAVLLFYKNRRYLAESVKLLLASSKGLSWSVENQSSDFQNVLSTFLRNLGSEKLLQKLLDEICTFDITAELERLQMPAYNALGNAQHRSMVCETLVEIYNCLADTVFYWTCQFPVSLTDLQAIIKAFDKLTAFEQNEDKSQPMSRVRATILLALLQSIDSSRIENADSDECLGKLVPFAKDQRTFRSFHEIILNFVETQNSDIAALVGLSWAVSLRALSQSPFSQEIMQEFVDEEEELFDRCFSEECRPFYFIRYRLLPVSKFFSAEEFLARKMHKFITQLLIYFPIKIKQLRLASEQEYSLSKSITMSGRDVKPTMHFEQFLLLIGDFYCVSSKFQLGNEFFTSNRETGAYNTHTDLFKFIRNTAESIFYIPPLYNAYLHMLAGLCQDMESAGHCFTLLNSFGSGGPNLKTVSLDHFFHSLAGYYEALRFGIQSTLTSYVGTVSAVIAPDELKALKQWLVLLSAIALHSSTCRLAFCESVVWCCVSNVVGIVACEVPSDLKALSLQFLANLGHSRELCTIILDGILAANLVAMSPNDGKLVGLKQELDERESRNETYAVSTSVIKLLTSLSKHGTLIYSTDERLRNYVDFAINSVAIHMLSRGYKSPLEKWSLVQAVGEFLQTVVSRLDFSQGNVTINMPGSLILIMILNDGPLFRLVLSVIDIGIELLDSYSVFPGYEKMESALLDFLKLLFNVLEKQESFLSLLQETNTDVLITSLDVLLRTINIKSGAPDYIVKIMSYTNHAIALPEHCLYSVKIIGILNSFSSVKSKILPYFCFKESLSQRILNGFTSCLDLDNVDASVDEDTSSLNPDGLPIEKIRAATASAVLDVLIDDIRSVSTENNDVATLGHFLLGFNIKSLKDTVFENPGISNTAKNCLHSTLNIAMAYGSRDNLVSINFESLVEPAFRLLFWLCASKVTGCSILRYLRSNYDFTPKCLLLTRKHVENEVINKMYHQEISAWIMKIAAIELKTNFDSKQRSNVNRILTILLKSNQPADVGRWDSFDATSDSAIERKEDGFKLLSLLDFIKTDEEVVETPTLRSFDPMRLSELISALTVTNSRQFQQCDVVRLHDILRFEASSFKDSAVIDQAFAINEEIESILESVMQYNRLQLISYVRHHCFDSWRQLAEVTLCFCQSDDLTIEQRIKIISVVLLRLLQMEWSSTLNKNVAAVVLSLSAALRCQFSSVVYNSSIGVTDSSFALNSTLGVGGRYVHSLNGTFVSSAQMHTLEELSHLNSLNLAFDRLLVYCCQIDNRRSPMARALLYGSIMNFLRLTVYEGTNSTDVQVAQYPNVKERMIDEHRRILSSHAADLADQLSKDACDGPEICRTLATTCLTTILTEDFCEQTVLSILSTRGYLTHLVNSLISEDDSKLSDVFSNQDVDLKPYYVFLARMDLLIAIASCDTGHHLLIQSGALNKLADCACFTVLPDKMLTDYSDDVTESLAARYRRAFGSCLRFCLSVLYNARSSKAPVGQAAQGVYRFFATNQDVISVVVRGGNVDTLDVSHSNLGILPSSSSKLDSFSIKKQLWNRSEVGNTIQRLSGLLALTFKLCDAALGTVEPTIDASDFQVRRHYFKKLMTSYASKFFSPDLLNDS